MNFVNGIASGVSWGCSLPNRILESVIDGRYGIGTLQGKALSLIGNQGVEGLGLLGVQAAGIFVAIGSKDDKSAKFGYSLKTGFYAGIFYLLCSTHVILKPLTSEAIKAALAKGILSGLDMYAVLKIGGKQKSRQKDIAYAYLSLRAADLVLNSGRTLQGLVRLNSQPLFDNLRSIRSWLPE